MQQATASCLPLFPMPDCLIVHTAQQFLDDTEAFDWARCSVGLLHAMRGYRIRRMVPLLVLLRRSEGCALLPGLESRLDEMRDPECWVWEPEDRARLVAVTTAALSSQDPSLLCHTDLYRREIGQATCLCLDHGLADESDIFARMHLLPRCIRTVRLEFGLCGFGRMQLPPSVTTLEVDDVGDDSFQDIRLPDPGLHQLLFDDLGHFNQPLDRLRLPSSLHTLRFGWCFNQPVDRLCLPSSLTDLTLGTGMLNQSGSFNQPVDALRLPEGLLRLRFSNCFNQSMDQLKLPSTLQYLRMGKDFNQPLLQWQPPASLTDLVLSDNWRLSVDQLRLPPALHHLIFPCNYYNPPIAGLLSFPPTLISLSIGGAFDQSLHSVPFPPSLTSLRLPGAFTQPLGLDDWRPPPALQELELGYRWNRPLSQLHLPPSLTSLALRSNAFNQPLQDFEWPPTLRSLSFDVSRWFQPRDCLPRNLPLSLQLLELWGPYERSDLWLEIALPPGCQLCDERGASLLPTPPATPRSGEHNEE